MKSRNGISINSLVPNEDAEIVLLEELYKASSKLDTATLISRAMSHFPQIQTPEDLNRETPSGRPWWQGRFRFDLSRLGSKGDAINIKRGWWRISDKGLRRIEQRSRTTHG
jgi:hypothetical protein